MNRSIVLARSKPGPTGQGNLGVSFHGAELAVDQSGAANAWDPSGDVFRGLISTLRGSRPIRSLHRSGLFTPRAYFASSVNAKEH